MDEFDGYPDALGAPLLMHEAGRIGGDDVLRASVGVVAHLVVAHLGGDHLLEHGESPAKSAAFIRSSGGHELNAFDLREQIQGFGKEGLMQLGGLGMTEPSQGAATVVQAHAVWKSGPRECIDLQDVVQKFDELERALSNRAHFGSLFDRVQIIPDVMNAAPRGCDHVVETREIAHVQRLRRRAFLIEAAVRHGLTATGLIARIDHLMPEALQQLECGDADFRKERVDIAGNEKSDAHMYPYLVVARCFT